MNERRMAEEASLLRHAFPDARAGVDDRANSGWFYVPRFPLPRGWSKAASELLIVVPAGYPHVPFDRFFLERGLRDGQGRSVAHFFEEQRGENPYRDRGWAWFCLHIQPGAWRPGPRPLQGDNVLTCVNVIFNGLSNAVPRR